VPAKITSAVAGC